MRFRDCVNADKVFGIHNPAFAPLHHFVSDLGIPERRKVADLCRPVPKPGCSFCWPPPNSDNGWIALALMLRSRDSY
jgi:hypothetical protein